MAHYIPVFICVYFTCDTSFIFNVINELLRESTQKTREVGK